MSEDERETTKKASKYECGRSPVEALMCSHFALLGQLDTVNEASNFYKALVELVKMPRMSFSPCYDMARPRASI